MVIQCADGSVAETYDHALAAHHPKQTFYAEVPHHLLDSVDNWVDTMIGFAFDTLHANHIELRVIDPKRSK